ncbi:MAG TPA: pilus motility taxis protein HmpF, partial [Allocoleopsis sp.]
LEQHRTAAQQLQAEVDRQVQEVHDRWQAWHQAVQAVEQSKLELATKQEALQLKQEQAKGLVSQLQSHEMLYQQVAQLSGNTSDKVDHEALGKMPLEELQTLAKDLETDLEKLSRFVHSQEEELTLQQEAIDELRQQIAQASEYDRLRLETELADEQDRYQMLNQTLVGQRRNLLDRQMVLKQHQQILARRQGYSTCDDGNGVDLSPVLGQIDQLRQQIDQQLKGLEQQIQQLQEAIQPIQERVNQETQQLDAQREELRQQDQQLRSQATAAADLMGRVHTYEETLQPIQDSLHHLKQKAESIASVMTQFQEASDYQLQAVHEMRDTVQHLTNSQTPELAAS